MKHQEAAASPASVSVDVEVLVLGSWLEAAAAGTWRGWQGSAARGQDPLRRDRGAWAAQGAQRIPTALPEVERSKASTLKV